MFKGKKVSVVFPAFNEEENIRNAILDFRKLKICDEIVVVDNNSRDRTVILAKKAGAQVVKQSFQGYGFALRKGMEVAKGDYVVLAEPDGTFEARDLLRLLDKLSDYDAVIGTRTNPDFINEGANMRGVLKWGNIALARITQILYQTNQLTDCGCTFRVFRKNVIKKILPHLSVGGSYFLPETVVLMSIFKYSFTEIPVNYYKRIGKSKITGSMKKSIEVGFKMLSLILRYRFFPNRKLINS